MSETNTFVITPDSHDQEDELITFLKSLNMKFEIVSKPYNQDMIEKIEKGRRDFQEGKGKKITLDELNALWK